MSLQPQGRSFDFAQDDKEALPRLRSAAAPRTCDPPAGTPHSPSRHHKPCSEGPALTLGEGATRALQPQGTSFDFAQDDKEALPRLTSAAHPRTCDPLRRPLTPEPLPHLSS